MIDTVRIEQMTWPQFADAVKAMPAAIVPIGAIEPHGRHAPLGSDLYIAQEIALRLGTQTGALVHPAVPIGTMNLGYTFLEFPGAISIEAKVIVGLITNIGVELHRNGVQQIALVNGHGPNATPLTVAAFEIHERCGAEVGILDWWTASGKTIAEIKGFSYATHADEIETSLVLATEHGDEVFLDEAVINSPEARDVPEEERQLYIQKVPFTRRMDSRYVGTSANMGDPSKATVETGQRLIDETVRVGVRLLAVLKAQA